VWEKKKGTKRRRNQREKDMKKQVELSVEGRDGG
jgi:hypothetical protein